MSQLRITPPYAGTNTEADSEARRSSQDWYNPKTEESISTTTATTSSSCASPQTDSSSVSASPATESSNQQFRFQVNDNSVSAIEEALKTEKEFIEYVMALPATRMDREVEKTFQEQPIKNIKKTVRSESSRKAGLDHLNNLCKLMEQLSELRESNVKLKRRIHYLEDSKSLNRDYLFPFMTKDDMAIVGIRSSNDIYKSHTLATMSHIQKENRERSKSTGTTNEYIKSKRRFPKWSKWKEALGLDRSNQFEIKRDKDNRSKAPGGRCCGDMELPLYVNSQGRNDASPARSLPDRNWYCGILQSSSDDVMGLSFENSEQNTSWENAGHPPSLCLSESEKQHQQTRRRKSSTGIQEGSLIKGKRKKSATQEQGEQEEHLLEKFDKDDLKKSVKTPWGRVKTIIQTRRDSVKQTKLKPPHRSDSRNAKTVDQTLEVVNIDQIKELDNNTDASNKKTENKQSERKASQEQVGKQPNKEAYSRSISNDADASSGQVSNLVQELQRNLSQDFSKKLEEWEKIKAKSSSTSKPDQKRTKSKKFDRGEKSFRQRLKDINWLEKELQKVQAETQRLSKEKQKCEKRALRLERLKEAILNGTDKKEVFVKTSAGEFRFEGISDAFTKKLYEWETKQGVGPELSTIALLDSCLTSKSQTSERAPLKKGHSRSDSSLADASQTPPTSSPCFKHSSSNKSTRAQLSRSNTEPDLLYAGQKETPDQHASSYSDILCSEVMNFHSQKSEREEHIEDANDRRETVSSDNNYYTLLEDNMYLLEKLRNKEEICRRLQGELETLDDKTVLMAKKHQDEMERYREKLWEIHRPGRKPRDLQSSLKLISCLKTRIEELQRCSEKLKQDRETLEDSFRYHSEQQARLADGLAEKMKELQEAGWSSASGAENEDRRRRLQKVPCDVEVLQKLADLSAQLLQQAREVDKTLAERSRQVCHLRWELLHRDVSMMLLQTEIHRSKWQNVAAGARRAKFRQKRSWSSSERLYPKERDDSEAEEWLQSKLKDLSTTTYSDWPKVDYGPSELVWTIHEMKKAILKLSAGTAEEPLDANQEQQGIPYREEMEVAESEKYDLGSVHSRSSSFSSEMSSHLCSSRPDSRLYENGRTCGQRRNSLGNLSSMSGADISDSSSVNEPEKSAPSLLRLPWKTWRSKDNVSTSSDSSVVEDDSLTTSWYHARRYELSGDERCSDDDLWSRELNIQFTSLNEEDEESPIAVRGALKLLINTTPSPSSSDKSSKNIDQTVVTEMESPNNKSINNIKGQGAACKQSNSNEIVVDKLPETGNIKSLKVRTSSSSNLFSPKSPTSIPTSPVVSAQETTISEPSIDSATKVCSDFTKVGPILPTYSQCLNVSGSASNQQLNSETENSSNSNFQGSSLLGADTYQNTPSVTVATHTVKLSYYNGSTSKVTQLPEGINTNDCEKGRTISTSTCTKEQTGDFQLKCLRTDFYQQTGTTCTIRGATEERAECSKNISNTCNASNEQSSSIQASELSKTQRSRDSLASLADSGFCKQSFFNLNSQVVKSIGNSSQSSTPSSPEADLSAKPKTGWLPLSIFRQK